jgi:hypothetical protein
LSTTNFIQADQVARSMLMEVLAFSPFALIRCYCLQTVIKVSGIYHKLIIPVLLMVLWYNGNGLSRCTAALRVGIGAQECSIEP